MSQIISTSQLVDEVTGFVQQKADVLVKLGITPAKVLSVVLTDLHQSKYLRDIAARNIHSLFACIMRASQLGLEIGSHLGHAYLVPRGGDKPQVTLVLGYKGLVFLLWDTSQIIAQATAVYEGDEWKCVRGLEPVLEHVERWQSKNLTHAYAIAQMPNQAKPFDVMSRGDIEAIRDGVTKWQLTPWNTHFEEMAKKTVLKRLCKQLPVSARVQQAMAIDSAAEAGKEQQLVAEETPQLPPAQSTALPKQVNARNGVENPLEPMSTANVVGWTFEPEAA